MEGGKIYPAIANVMAAIGAVGKNKKNVQQGFAYRGIDDVMNAINPALTENKVFVVPEVLDCTREDRTTLKGNPIIYSVAKVRYTFFAEDGSYIQAVVIGEGMDSGDKSMNKAMSIAYKYACFQVFCIPTEEMKDPDAECHDLAPRQQAQRTASGSGQPARRSGSANAQAYTAPQQAQQAPAPPAQEVVFVNQNHIEALRAQMRRTGVNEDMVLTMAKAGSMEEITVPVFTSLMKKFEKTKSRQEPENVPDDAELPFR